MRKNFLLALFIVGLIVLAFSSVNLVRAATSYKADYSNTTASSGSSQGPQFVVQAIQYDPYPVNPGEWFDIWVKAQNVGLTDALNAQFQIVPNYPFEQVDNGVQSFGMIPGTVNAYKYQSSLGDSQPEANQVIMKFRVKVADNAPDGQSSLKLQMNTNQNAGTSFTYNIPVSIAKTRTDFTLVTQGSSAQGTSFAIANTGENAATAVIVSIPEQQGVVVSGARSSIIGNLNSGDFTSVTFQVAPRRDVNAILVDVSYTDTTGVRNTVEENVSVSSVAASNFSQFGRATARQSSSSNSFLTVVVYLVLGALIGLGVTMLTRKTKGSKHESR